MKASDDIKPWPGRAVQVYPYLRRWPDVLAIRLYRWGYACRMTNAWRTRVEAVQVWLTAVNAIVPRDVKWLQNPYAYVTAWALSAGHSRVSKARTMTRAEQAALLCDDLNLGDLAPAVAQVYVGVDFLNVEHRVALTNIVAIAVDQARLRQGES